MSYAEKLKLPPAGSGYLSGNCGRDDGSREDGTRFRFLSAPWKSNVDCDGAGFRTEVKQVTYNSKEREGEDYTD